MSADHITVEDFRAIVGEKTPFEHVFPLVKTTGGTWQIRCSLANSMGAAEILDQYYTPSAEIPAGVIGKIIVESITTRGNLRPTVPTIVKTGKNLGKTNALNVWCQTLRDALGKYNLQTRRNTVQIKPMLAKIFEAKKATFPAWVSPKLDGLRCITRAESGRVQFLSRGGKEYPSISTVAAELLPLLSAGYVLDGELYMHGVPLQRINAIVKNTGEMPAGEVKYCVYDIIAEGVFAARLAMLKRLFAEYALGESVELIQHTRVESVDEINAEYQKYLAAGYEGLVCRYNGEYEGKRSGKMVKLKPTFDDEFKLVDWGTGEAGKAAGLLMLQFQTAGGERFWATPALSEESRRDLAARMPQEWEKWRGKMLTVSYAGLSIDSVPLQPRTRMEEKADR